MDILGRFIHVEKPSKGSKARPTVIFPRFHQWDAVRRLQADAKATGAGRNYLVQHSAGSGKSNSIAWLAHRFSSLHDETDQKVFDKVVVITDRVILDRQLQDTISQFRARHRGGPADRQVIVATRRGTGGGAGPDHRHDPAEVPVPVRQDLVAPGAHLCGDRG